MPLKFVKVTRDDFASTLIVKDNNYVSAREVFLYMNGAEYMKGLQTGHKSNTVHSDVIIVVSKINWNFFLVILLNVSFQKLP
jgi:hypothetical protein